MTKITKVCSTRKKNVLLKLLFAVMVAVLLSASPGWAEDKSAPPKDADTFLIEGLQKYKQGRYQQAYNDFIKALEQDHSSVEALYCLGSTSVKLHSLDKAAKILTTMQQLAPGHKLTARLADELTISKNLSNRKEFFYRAQALQSAINEPQPTSQADVKQKKEVTRYRVLRKKTMPDNPPSTSSEKGRDTASKNKAKERSSYNPRGKLYTHTEDGKFERSKEGEYMKSPGGAYVHKDTGKVIQSDK